MLKDLSESESIDWLFSNQTLVFSSLHFAIAGTLGFHAAGWEYEIWIEIPRSAFGLDSLRKPGDIDILIVPSLGGDRFAEKSVAIEVKKFYVPEERLGKSPNSYGFSQANGLLEAGFPYVGLLHVGFVEFATAQYRARVPMVSDDNGRLLQQSEITEYVEVAVSPWLTQERHEGRFTTKRLNSDCGYKIQVFGLSKDNSAYITQNANESRQPEKNKHAAISVIDKIRYLELEPDFKLIIGHGKIEIIEANKRKMDRLFERKPLNRWREPRA